MKELRKNTDNHKEEVRTLIGISKDLRNKNVDETNKILMNTLLQDRKEVVKIPSTIINYIFQPTENLMFKRRTLLKSGKRNQ